MTSATDALQQVALTIAGSDPSGGAGIQADLKTFTALGVYSGAVISSLTVQNTKGVHGVYPVDPDLVRQQIEYVLDDLNISHIKIGMLGSAAVAEAVCTTLAEFKGQVVYDPVLVSTSGRELIDRQGLETVRGRLFGLCTVLTPNLPELAMLTGNDCSSRNLLLMAAENLLRQHPRMRTVIITGGHGKDKENTITDHMLTKSTGVHHIEHQEISHARITSPNTHGTGCTFSAAFTACHLLTGDDSEAFHKASAYMARIIKESAPFKIGNGTGPLLHHLKLK